MKYFKNIIDGYITSISTVFGVLEISEAEYDEILRAVQNAPVPPEGYEYLLREDMTWELHELPSEPEDYDELEDAKEALAVLGVE